MPIPTTTRATLAAPTSLLSLLLLPAGAWPQAPRHRPAAELAAPTQLPVTRVSLYKNGVGFFEHSGRVTGSQAVTIDFTTAQLNDVLQSLTAIDLGGGRIAGAGYNSTTPLEQQLKSLPLGLGPDPSAIDFYNAIRGARVEVHSGAVSITGRLLNIETRTTPEGNDRPATEKILLTVISDEGTARTLELTSTTSVRLLDTSLHQDVTRYLQLLASTRNQGLRHLTLQDKAPANGSGARDLRVSYISEVPVWKSTYRILFTDPAAGATASGANQTATLQGWSVVDNTTGADWLNVQLSLIAGSPQSFIQPLSVPYYARRPEIPLPQEAQLTPQTHESGDAAQTLASGGVVGGVMGGVGAAPTSMAGMGSGSGGGIGPGSGGNMGGGVAAQRAINGGARKLTFPAAAPTISYEQAVSDSITPQTTMNAFDDYFEYRITQPITIRKNESALVPILQTPITSERVTLWSEAQPRALRALWITNTSPLTLDRGSFSIVENGNFGGEGLLDPIHPGERRLLSYAADQAVRITTESPRNSSRVTSVTAAKGVLIVRRTEVAEVTYVVHNAAPEPRTIILEHAVRQGYKLDSASGTGSSDAKPEETTPAAYRFRVRTGPGETVRLHVGERRIEASSYQLTRSDDNQLAYILKQTEDDPQLVQALQPILDARRRVSDAQNAVNAGNARLTTLRAEEERQRANIVALKDTDKAAQRRFVDELGHIEDQVLQQQKQQESLETQLQAAQADLAGKIETLQFSQTLQP